jgi:hypothetical protein
MLAFLAKSNKMAVVFSGINIKRSKHEGVFNDHKTKDSGLDDCFFLLKWPEGSSVDLDDFRAISI